MHHKDPKKRRTILRSIDWGSYQFPIRCRNIEIKIYQTKIILQGDTGAQANML